MLMNHNFKKPFNNHNILNVLQYIVAIAQREQIKKKIKLKTNGFLQYKLHATSYVTNLQISDL